MNLERAPYRIEIRIIFSIINTNEISRFSRETMEEDSAVGSW